MNQFWEFGNTSAGRVLKAIQVRGNASIKDVAGDLGVTASAVRLQLTQLQARGAVRADKVRAGVGRPRYIYSVTPDAHGLLYHDNGDLTKLVLEEVARSQGPAALQGVLRKVGERLADTYRDQVWSSELEERVSAWVELLDRRGIAVEIDEVEGKYIVREYGCPYQNVALKNRAFCEMERQVMATLLETGVVLTECALDGHRGCEFTISAKE